MSAGSVIHPLSRRTFLRLSSAFALGSALRPLSAFASAMLVERAAFVMGSVVTIKAYADDARLCNGSIDRAFGAMREIDAAMSVYAASSEVSALNRHAYKRPVACSAGLAEVLQAAARYSSLTEGAFDITLQPLSELYGFRDGPGTDRFPSDSEIAAVMEGSGMRNVAVDRSCGSVAFGHRRTRIDLGGIAVGHALDRAAAILRSDGIGAALINHSGDIVAIGTPPDEPEGWEIGITDPRRPDAVATTVRIRDEALATSGNYRSVRRIEDRTIGHILDPASGRSASALLSSSVIAPTALAADALSTGTFVLGAVRSELIIREPNTRMIAVAHGGAIRATEFARASTPQR